MYIQESDIYPFILYLHKFLGRRDQYSFQLSLKMYLYNAKNNYDLLHIRFSLIERINNLCFDNKLLLFTLYTSTKDLRKFKS